VKSRSMAAAILALVAIPGGCGTTFADRGSFAGGGAALLGFFVGPLVVVAYIAKDVAEFLSSPLPWDTDDEDSTH
jgi:hypothetical protein